MTNTPKNSKKDAGGDDSQRRLLRSPSERMLAGVAGGIAGYLGIDPTFVRLGFVVATFFGGFGLLAYLVMAVIVPEDDGTGNPVKGRRPPLWALILLGLAALAIVPGPLWGWGDGWWFGVGLFWTGALILAGAGLYRAFSGHWPGQRTTDGEAETTEVSATGKAPSRADGGAAPGIVRAIAIILLALTALGAALGLAALGGWAAATGNGEVVAGVVIALGVALAATAFFGELARRGAPWLLALALLLAAPAGAIAAADVRFDSSIGERNHNPTSLADIPDDGYELGVGELKVDLRELNWAEGQLVTLPAEVGLGQLVISVPSDVCVFGHAEAKAGDLLVRGEENSGVEAEFERGAPPADQRRLQLDVELQAGQLVVTDRDPDDHGDHGWEGRDVGDEIAPESEECRS